MTDLPTSDAQLVERMAAGDRRAHEQLGERHRLSLYAHVYALLADAAATEEVLPRRWSAPGAPRVTSIPALAAPRRGSPRSRATWRSAANAPSSRKSRLSAWPGTGYLEGASR